jgi:hypothetical protein
MHCHPVEALNHLKWEATTPLRQSQKFSPEVLAVPRIALCPTAATPSHHGCRCTRLTSAAQTLDVRMLNLQTSIAMPITEIYPVKCKQIDHIGATILIKAVKASPLYPISITINI